MRGIPLVQAEFPSAEQGCAAHHLFRRLRSFGSRAEQL